MKYKLIISDYDATLSDSHVMPTVVRDAIERYRNNGGKFVICTGRPYNSVKKILDNANLTIDALCVNQGSQIIIDGNFIKEGGMDGKTVASLVKDARAFGKEATTISREYHYEGNGPGVLKYINYHSVHTPVHYHEDLAEYCQNSNETFCRIILQKDPDENEKVFQKYITDKYDGKIIVNSGAPWLIEMVSKDSNKYTGARFIANYFNIKESETITMGDSTNDLMLLKFGLSFAVLNAVEEVKQAVSHIVADVADFPIVDIINTILDGKDF